MTDCQHDPLAPNSTLEVGRTIFVEWFARCRVCRVENHINKRTGRPDKEGGRTVARPSPTAPEATR